MWLDAGPSELRFAPLASHREAVHAEESCGDEEVDFHVLLRLLALPGVDFLQKTPKSKSNLGTLARVFWAWCAQSRDHVSEGCREQ